MWRSSLSCGRNDGVVMSSSKGSRIPTVVRLLCVIALLRFCMVDCGCLWSTVYCTPFIPPCIDPEIQLNSPKFNDLLRRISYSSRPFLSSTVFDPKIVLDIIQYTGKISRRPRKTEKQTENREQRIENREQKTPRGHPQLGMAARLEKTSLALALARLVG
jgi:hypothetical protein